MPYRLPRILEEENVLRVYLSSFRNLPIRKRETREMKNVPNVLRLITLYCNCPVVVLSLILHSRSYRKPGPMSILFALIFPELSTGPGSQEVFHIRFLNGKINTMLIQAELKLGERLLILPSVLPLSRRNLHPSEVPDQTQQRIILLSEPQAQSLPLAPAPSVRSELRKYFSSSTTFSLAQKLH